MTESSFIHRFEPATGAGSSPLLLLHGTGGDENDLLGLGKMISPGSALLSPRGRVLEHGMPRFFRRLAEGVFDEDDVRRRAHELGDFVAEARQRYGSPRRSRSASPTAPTSQPRCCCWSRTRWQARSCSAPWCRCRIRRRLSSAASPSCFCQGRLIRSFRRAIRRSLPRCCRKPERGSHTRCCRRAINCHRPT